MWAKRSSPKALLRFLDAFMCVLPQSCSGINCDRTTSKMTGLSPKIISGDSRRSENACKHTYEAFKTIISLKIKLLHFILKISMIRSRRFFKRQNIFTEAFHSTIKDIHLTLEVKTSFGNSMPAMGSSTESSSQKPGVPTDTHHRHCRKRETKKPEYHKVTKQSFSDYAQQDLSPVTQRPPLDTQ